MAGKEEMRIGCSGWSYKDWVGPFYPSDAEAKDYLKLYSRTFDCVEIDSSFYRIPSPGMVSQWKSGTPDGFTFSPSSRRRSRTRTSSRTSSRRFCTSTAS